MLRTSKQATFCILLHIVPTHVLVIHQFLPITGYGFGDTGLHRRRGSAALAAADPRLEADVLRVLQGLLLLPRQWHRL